MLFDLNTTDSRTPPPNLSDFAGAQLGGVEYYPGNAARPPQFRASECGVLLLWSR